MEIASMIIIDCFGVWAIVALIAAAAKRGY